MNRNLLTGLVCAGLALSAQASMARNPLKNLPSQTVHQGTVQGTLTVGDYTAFCNQPINGSAVADLRNINVGNRRRQVVHLSAQAANGAFAFLTNVGSEAPLTLTGPIQFSLVRGNGRYFQVDVTFIPPGATTATTLGFVTPDTRLTGPNLAPLFVLGNGRYVVPLIPGGSNGIPYGSTVTNVAFYQSANPNNCSRHTSDFNDVFVNKQSVPLDTSLASECGLDCTTGGGNNPEN